MSRIIQILVLAVYFLTSSFVIGVNKWSGSSDSESQSFAYELFSKTTLPLSDNPADSNTIPFLFKDPSDDGSVVLEYYPSFSTLEYNINHVFFPAEDKLKDPYLNIFSPPPQL